MRIGSRSFCSSSPHHYLKPHTSSESFGWSSYTGTALNAVLPFANHSDFNFRNTSTSLQGHHTRLSTAHPALRPPGQGTGFCAVRLRGLRRWVVLHLSTTDQSSRVNRPPPKILLARASREIRAEPEFSQKVATVSPLHLHEWIHIREPVHWPPR